MPGWLSNISERSRQVECLEGHFKHGQTAYVLLDQRHAVEQCRSLLSLTGKRDFVVLFAGTPLSPLLEASPWLLDLEVGSEAWRYAQTLCQQRLGWVCQGRADQTLLSIANHLGALFVLDDPHGGKSLINLQQPAVYTALLAGASNSIYPHWLSPLAQVATPTSQGQWLMWQVKEPTSTTPERWQLTIEMEEALKESQQAWWLSSTTTMPMAELPDSWLIRLGMLIEAGITRTEHFKRLLPLIQRSEALPGRMQAILAMDTPARKKTQGLESLI